MRAFQKRLHSPSGFLPTLYGEEAFPDVISLDCNDFGGAQSVQVADKHCEPVLLFVSVGGCKELENLGL